MALAEQIQTQLKSLPIEKQIEVFNFIAILHQQVQTVHYMFTEVERRQQIKRAFETLAELKTFADIKDPVEWQRQIRRDRVLVGREE